MNSSDLANFDDEDPSMDDPEARAEARRIVDGYIGNKLMPYGDPGPTIDPWEGQPPDAERYTGYTRGSAMDPDATNYIDPWANEAPRSEAYSAGSVMDSDATDYVDPWAGEDPLPGSEAPPNDTVREDPPWHFRVGTPIMENQESSQQDDPADPYADVMTAAAAHAESDGAAQSAAPPNGAPSPGMAAEPPTAATGAPPMAVRPSSSIAQQPRRGVPARGKGHSSNAIGGPEKTLQAQAMVDDGTPSEGSVIAQQVADRIGGIFRGLSGQDRRHTGDEMAARRQQGLQQRQARQNQLNAQETRRADMLEQRRIASEASERNAEYRDRQLAQSEQATRMRGEHMSRQDSLAEQRAAEESELRRSQGRLANARADQSELTGRQTRESNDPASQLSTQARERYADLVADRVLARNPRADRRQAHDEALAEVDGVSAHDIERMEGRLANVSIGNRGNARGDGSGAGGGVARESAVRQLEANGMAREDAEAAVSAMGTRRAHQALVTDRLGTQRQEHLRGNFTDRQVEEMGEDVDASLAMRQALERSRGVSPELLQAVLHHRPLPTGFSSAEVQQATSAVNALQGAVIRMRSGTAASEREAARIATEMGQDFSSDPSAFAAWRDNEIRNQQEGVARIRARFDEDAVREYEGRLQREGAAGGTHRSFAQPGSRTTQSGNVRESDGAIRIQREDGVLGWLPPGVEMPAGARRVQ